MLKFLTVKNFALIRHLELEFNDGFTVITGETGAGKSILLGALDLIRGKRADMRMLLEKETKCIVEGTFAIKGYRLKPLFEQHDLDYDDFAVLRRELTSYGKSRAFINDTPVTLGVLAEMSARLMDIHAQEETSSLNNPAFQFQVIDGFTGLMDKVNDYRIQFEQLSRFTKEFDGLNDELQQVKAEQDYIAFLLDELEEAGLHEGEQETLEKELKILEHAEEIRSVLFQSGTMLEDEDGGILDQLRQVIQVFQKVSGFDSNLEELYRRLDASQIDLADVHREIQKYERQVIVDPARTEAVNERLSLMYNLQQKHRVGTVAELLQKQDELRSKIRDIDDLENRIQNLKATITAHEKQVLNQARLLSDERKKAIPAFEKEMISALEDLGMSQGRFKVQLANKDKPGKFGIDHLSFLFNANRGGALNELNKVASGGEKSRLMLAMKSRVSKKALLPTIIFDEIDAGVSGAVADKVGSRIRDLSGSMQVIAITHLPQIAGKGDHHFMVYKYSTDHTTTTDVKKLNSKERLEEIAKLLSGKEVTGASMESAKHLLEQ